MKTIVNITILITLLNISGCTEKRIDDTLVVTSNDSWSQGVIESECLFDDYAAFTGDYKLADGSWQIERVNSSSGGLLRIRWTSTDYLHIFITDPDGWEGAMDKGRKVVIGEHYGKISILLNTRNYRDMQPKSGVLYLIPNSDGTLEVDWCDLTFSKYYYDSDIYTTGSGGVTITP